MAPRWLRASNVQIIVERLFRRREKPRTPGLHGGHCLSLISRSLMSGMNDEELARQLQREYDQEAATGSTRHELLVNDRDEELAKLLQTELDEDIHGPNKASGKESFENGAIADADDPNPDLHQIFLYYNQKYFRGILDGVEVRWSSKMTLCAGMCYYYRGGYCSVRLSEPLLKFRTREDYIDVLLHEMIHAYLFLTKNYRDHNGHGPEFLKLAKEINEKECSHITVFHKFINEVNHYRVHVWKCDGPCQHRPPFFGSVRRSMNRKPQPADSWWADHQKSCGGTYHKIDGPEFHDNNDVKGKKKNTLDKYFKKESSGSGESSGSSPPRKKQKKGDDVDAKSPKETKKIRAFPGRGFTLGGSSKSVTPGNSFSSSSGTPKCKRTENRSSTEDDKNKSGNPTSTSPANRIAL
ncbi:hypothetical protein SeLEV6574_g03414 [Synchytrium endobioticum]|uniref:SprT-like domain-containing protein n=1 Tax=Synchytrium endobioticum TaxID=286115 RepID=A0A507D467_9FUNG|nr:hypothetical protein SeLEV6574_g03414 [Synchytrium endobioticum]